MSTLSGLFRLASAGWTLAPALRAVHGRKPQAGQRLARALQSLGPAYIKLGQMLATRPDIVGADVAMAVKHACVPIPARPANRC